MDKNRVKMNVLKIIRIPIYIFKIFPVKRNRLIFQSFNGNDYSDSCKAMVDYLHKNYPEKYEMYWVAKDASGLKLPEYAELHSVKRHSLKYFYICFTAQVALCNMAQESTLPLHKKQKLVNVWHGMPYKTLGYAKVKNAVVPNYNKYSLFLSPCKFFTEEVIRQSFKYSGPVLEIGLLRNDILFKKDNCELKKTIYDLYNINYDVKIALFAPTFRGDHENVDTHLDFEQLMEALQKRFGGEWRLFYREHPMLVDRRNKEIEGIINVTFYPDIMELLVVSEVLITDYSSSMWDFALTGKPVFLYAPDIKDYTEDRGFYVDMENLPFQLGHNNQELSNNIGNFDNNSYHEALDIYFKNMGSFEHGNACEALAREYEKWCE